jgi:hypothetical protein
MIRRLSHAAPQATGAIALVMAAVLLAACGSSHHRSPAKGTLSSRPSGELAPIHGPYAPRIAAAGFRAGIDNPYFPLRPGTTFHYRGVAENGRTPQTDDMVVTHRTKVIMGITATVVRDTVSSDGKPIERTFDWYAQDKAGNVWYMGEDTRELKHGRFVKQSDSWEAGVDGAQPGIIMPGTPRRGDAYRQEYSPHHAEDQARVLGGGGSLTVPAGSYKTTVLTEETSPRLDPGVAERKYYVAGVGDVKEHAVRGNHEQIELVRVTP